MGLKRHVDLFFGLDGTFLKAEVRGVLLSVASRDVNNQMFPIE